MFRNLDAEQARKRLTDAEVADYLGISRISYVNKKKSKKFNVIEVKKLCKLFGCPFEYLFNTDDEQEADNVQDNQAS